ncbi:MAG: hypothetical protein IJJ79_03050 [Lachnospiraceae bacterium]|jgi:uncharacterized protein with PhoU and TrkA domain|nr:hypothetical protein [Lachnospiraceae bacterium]
MNGFDTALIAIESKEEAERLSAVLKVNNIDSDIVRSASDIYALGAKRFTYIIYVREKDMELSAEIARRFVSSRS